MNHREQLRPLAFDEQRALEELQKLHRGIQRARGDREQAEAEFDTFVRGFRTPEPSAPAPPPREPVVVTRESTTEPPLPASAREVASPPAPAALPSDARPQSPPARDTRPEPAPHQEERRPEPTPAVPRPQPAAIAPPTPQNPPSAPQPIAQEPSIEAPARQDEPLAAAPVAVVPSAEDGKPSTSKRRAGLHPALGVAIAAVFVSIVLFGLLGGRTGSEQVQDVPSGVAAPDTSAQQAPPPQPAAAPPVTAPAGVEVEMITTRPVWVRVTLDGRRAIERELPAGQSIPLRAEQTILIRAGDGGAVTVRRSGGPDTRLGEDGFPITRTFAVQRRDDAPAVR